jgi:hypothetical protein
VGENDLKHDNQRKAVVAFCRAACNIIVTPIVKGGKAVLAWKTWHVLLTDTERDHGLGPVGHTWKFYHNLSINDTSP